MHNGRVAGRVTMVSNRVAREAVEGRGATVKGSVDAAPVNDAMMAIATKLLYGDIADRVAVVAYSASNMFAAEGLFVVIGATFDKSCEMNALKTNADREMENKVRGWAFASVTVQVVAGERSARDHTICNVRPVGESCNKFGSIGISPIAVGDGEVGHWGPLSSPNVLSGELQGSISPKPWC